MPAAEAFAASWPFARGFPSSEQEAGKQASFTASKDIMGARKASREARGRQSLVCATQCPQMWKLSSGTNECAIKQAGRRQQMIQEASRQAFI